MSVTPTRSEDWAPPVALSEVRAGVLRQPGLAGPRLRSALAIAYDGWLSALFASASQGAGGLALVAVGGLGRREPAPYSDLDLVLLHEARTSGLSELADALWYPIWDSGFGLDHSVRTVEQAVAVTKDDLKALLGMLDLRHLAGDAGLTGRLRERVLEGWRGSARKRAGELQELAAKRAATAGEAAFLLEPNLKDSAGGLRDAQALRYLSVAQLVDVPVAVREAHRLLLDVRGELHRVTGRAEDVLRLQEQDAVAEALGIIGADGGPDRDAVLKCVNEAARTIAHAVDVASRRIELTPAPSLRRRVFGGPPPAEQRVGLANDVVAQAGEVVLARDADPRAEPALMLRAARAAAQYRLPLGQHTLERFAVESAPMPNPWPAPARDEFVTVLGLGHAAIPVLESLDLTGLLGRLIPEWEAVRCRAQHSPVHRFTVDRHLLETAANAAVQTRDVDRPDLLLIGALLHDIGKGYPGDHSVVGAEHAAAIAWRMGFAAADVATIHALARHHLLLPDTATRRDLDDPRTVEMVAATVESVELLDLLHALTVADGIATGTSVAWSDWKAGLVAELVHRTRAVVRGAPLPEPPPLDDLRRELAEAGALAVVVNGEEVTVAAPDAPGTLHRSAGVLALHALDVRSASISTHRGMAVNSFVVNPRFGRVPDPALIRTDLASALGGRLDLTGRLHAKEQSYGASRESAGPATVHWFDDAATDATILEFRADDAIGLLFRVTAALERCGLDVRSARISSLGGAAVDAFYLTTRAGEPVPVWQRSAVEAALAGI